jgi:hypothetical protein
MPATVNVNMMTVVHAGSAGVSPAFPDVCKTPTPAGPVPIPYPNVAQSSDTADGSSTVKVDGNPIMLKESNFKMSTGDEAGSAMNVVSNKIKGKAEPMLYSMDVKVDGKNVFRLTDMMLQNCGSSPGTPPASEVQAPLPEGILQSEECEALKKKRDDQGENIACENSGMYESHFNAIKEIAQEFNVIFYFRQTAKECHPWIKDRHQPKPHKVFKANTIKDDKVKEVDVYLRDVEEGLRRQGKKAEDLVSWEFHPAATNVGYFPQAAEYVGIVGEPVSGTYTSRKPVKYVSAPQDTSVDYTNRWITGDYDLYQILRGVVGCKEVNQNKFVWPRVKAAINKKCSWDAIQHGPQAQWVPTEHEKAEGAPDISFPAEMAKGFKANNPSAKIEIPGRNAMKVFDDKLTVISPGGVVYLETQQDVFDALKCRECDQE